MDQAHRRTPPRPARLLLIAAGAMAIAGCLGEPKRYDDPVAMMTADRIRRDERWAATKQAEAEHFSDPARVKALQAMVWQRGYPPRFSNYAVDQLVAVDEEAAKTFLADAILLVRDWETIHHIIDTAVRRNWRDFSPALVAQYSLRTPAYDDDERPEKKAIETLNPGQTAAAVAMEVFSGKRPGRDARTQAMAWQLLSRLMEPGELKRRLARLEPTTPMVADFQAGAADLHVIPVNKETATWLTVLRTEPNRTYWNRLKQIVTGLSEGQKRGLELRHLAVVAWAADHDPSALTMNRAELMTEARSHYDARRHHLRGPTYDGPMEDHPQRLHDWRDELVWGDLLVMRLIRKGMADPHAVRKWFAQADADLKDRSTEYGGLIKRVDGKVLPTIYAPATRLHDLKYVPPAELVLDAYTAYAHYHFHAQEYRNRRYAGPGVGDLKRTAKTQQFNSIVLTFIDENTLNVDYYQPDEAVIDLGEIHRPR